MELKFPYFNPIFKTKSYSNRTFMELKWIRKNVFFVWSVQLQSHLYGIEIDFVNKIGTLFRELQSHLYGIEMRLGADKLFKGQVLQSHLYGIEIQIFDLDCLMCLWLQSHLYGIEIFLQLSQIRWLHYSNRTFMELK